MVQKKITEKFIFCNDAQTIIEDLITMTFFPIAEVARGEAPALSDSND